MLGDLLSAEHLAHPSPPAARGISHAARAFSLPAYRGALANNLKLMA